MQGPSSEAALLIVPHQQNPNLMASCLQSSQIPHDDAPSHALPRAFWRSNTFLALSQTLPRNSSRKRNTSSLQTPPSLQLSPAPHSSRKLGPSPQFPQSRVFLFFSPCPLCLWW